MSPLHADFTLIGVAHLLPLPGGPNGSSGFAAVRARALHDAQVLADAGFDGIILENFGDAPFPAGPVDAHVVALVAMLAADIKARHALAVGINLLRNDAHAAMGVAAASGADFIRVNIHAGAMVTDQGLLQGDAHRTLRYRRELGVADPGPSHVRIAADVLVKHAVPLGDVEIGAVAADTARRGGAEILIVTGEGTGKAADPARVRRVREVVPDVPVWLGSGVSVQTLPLWMANAQGAIIGTAVHEDSDITKPLDAGRAAAIVAAARAAART